MNKDILEIQFANLHGKNVFSAVHTISVYALLVKARENGSCEWGIEDNPGGGYLELKFEGLPKF